MKKYYYLFATLLVCLPVACNKVNEQEENPQTPTITYIRANGNEDGTKGSVDGTSAAFTWNTGDQIAVYTTDRGYMVSTALEEEDDGKSTVDFGFTDLTDGDRANFAIFPAALVSGIVSDYTATSLKLNLPASYTLAEVENEVSPTPMIASNAPGGSLSFKALCPLLRITVNNIPKQTKRIEFDFNGNKVQGEFTLKGVTPGDTAIATDATEGTDDIITVTMAGNTEWHNYIVVNLPVPTGTYGNITITAKDESGLPVLKLTTPIKSDASAWKPKRKASRTMTAALPVFTLGPGEGAKKITFAPGNLQYQASTNTWRFAEHQYNIVGGYWTAKETTHGNVYEGAVKCDNSNYSDSYTGWIDLFAWGTSGQNHGATAYQPWNTSINNADYYAYGSSLYDLNSVTPSKADWGYNVISGYPSGTWYTPSGGAVRAEGLAYILSDGGRRPDGNISTSGLPAGENSSYATYVKAKVGGINGLIVFPDVYIHPSGISVTSDVSPIIYSSYTTSTYNPDARGKGKGDYDSGANRNFTQFNISFEDWDKMEAAGAVFLPAGGYCDNTTYTNATGGYYWSREHYDDDNVYRIDVHRYLLSTRDNDGPRHRRYSVRLIRDLN